MSGWQNGQIFVAGRWVKCDDRKSIYSPWNKEQIAEICQASTAELENATVAAERAATDFFRQPRHVKSHLCQEISNAISRRAHEIAKLITAESGKPIQYARGEVKRAETTFKLAAHEALRFTGEVLPLDISPAAEKFSGYSMLVPYGPIAAISPFNFPLNLVAHKIAPALAVGCPVVLKPAPQTPLTALLLAEIMEDAGVPPGVISVLPMSNENAEAMVRDDRFGVLSFTGSAKVGWHLKSICGRKKALLELGGNAPAIVHNDADIEHAVDRLVHGSFAAAGQVCIKAQRLLIHRDVYETFIKHFIAATSVVKTGDPSSDDTVVGPLIDEKSADRVQAWIKEATDAGAIIRYGGGRHNAVIEPTILVNVPADARCMTEEIFGPVVTLEQYDSIDNAIEQANNTIYGLQAAVFTFDSRIVELASRDLRYGGVVFNDSPMVRVDNYPYGGSKDSGLGREGVRYTMAEYTQPRMIVKRSMI